MGDKFDRRTIIAGGIAFLGAGLTGRAALALPRDAGNDFRKASRLLLPYGIGVSGDTGRDHDTIRIGVRPLDNTQYVETISVARNGQIDPCWVTEYLDNDVVGTHFHPTAGGTINPCIRTSIFDHSFGQLEVFNEGALDPCVLVGIEMFDGGRIGDVDFTHFHPGASINPCIKTTIVGHTRAVHEVFDLLINPCVRVNSEMLEGGHIGDVDFTHFHPGAGIAPCVRTTIVGHERAVHEIFDLSINPCVRVDSEMLEGGHIGPVIITHIHATAIDPCWVTTMPDHEHVTHELFGGPVRGRPGISLAAEMVDPGVIGAVTMNIDDTNADLTITVGGHTYKLRDGALVEVA